MRKFFEKYRGCFNNNDYVFIIIVLLWFVADTIVIAVNKSIEAMLANGMLVNTGFIVFIGILILIKLYCKPFRDWMNDDIFRR